MEKKKEVASFLRQRIKNTNCVFVCDDDVAAASHVLFYSCARGAKKKERKKKVLSAPHFSPLHRRRRVVTLLP